MIWAAVGPAARRRTVAAALIACIVALFEFLALIAMLPVIRALLPGGQTGGQLEAAPVILAIAAIAASNVASFLGNSFLIYHSCATCGVLGARLYGSWLSQDLTRFYAHSTSERISTIVAELDRLQYFVIRPLTTGGARLVTVVLVVAAIAYVSPKAAITGAIALPALYCVLYLAFRGRLANNALAVTQASTRRVQTMTESFHGIRDVLSHGWRRTFAAEFNRNTRQLMRAQARNQRMLLVPRAILEPVVVGGMLLLVVILRATASGGEWAGDAAFLAFGGYRLLPALHELFSSMGQLRGNIGAVRHVARHLRAVTQACTADQVAEDRRRCGVTAARLSRPISLELTRLRFAHPGRPETLIDVKSFVVAPGEWVGIRGPSGGGKTTLADLIVGLLRPVEGIVALNGIALDDLPRLHIREAVAYVPQHVALTSGTIRENLQMGLRTPLTEERAIDLLRGVALDRAVMALPGGLDARLGEAGAGLSGGQRQRLALARELARDPGLLVLDEATSALDEDSETVVIDTIRRTRPHCTVLAIAHRPAVLRACDRVLEMKCGTLTPFGGAS